VLSTFREKVSSEERFGIDIIARAAEEPLRQIVANGGHEPSVILNKVVESNKASEGFDAKKECFVDMFAEGIIDPTKVTRSALQNAASVASLLLTTECMIAERPKDEKAAPSMGGGYPGMM
jgi:chaperonin GroEL